MKSLAVLSLVVGLAGICLGDIQDPPANDYGPTRKLGRGFSNFLWAPTEIIVNINKVNKEEGNNAAFGYGVVRGVGRSATRHVAGLKKLAPIVSKPVCRKKVLHSRSVRACDRFVQNLQNTFEPRDHHSRFKEIITACNSS